MMTVLSFVAFLVIVFIAAASGAIFSPGAWYRSLDRPSWTPPDWVFPVVWTILYFMIAIAGWLVWQAEGVGLALAVWGANLVVNAAWSWIMFGLRQIGLALADVSLLWLLTVAFIFVAAPVGCPGGVAFRALPCLGDHRLGAELRSVATQPCSKDRAVKAYRHA